MKFFAKIRLLIVVFILVIGLDTWISFFLPVVPFENSGDLGFFKTLSNHECKGCPTMTPIPTATESPSPIPTATLLPSPTASVTPINTATPDINQEWLTFSPVIFNDFCSIKYFPQLFEIEDNDSYSESNGLLRSSVTYEGYPDDLKDYFSFYLCDTKDVEIRLTNYTGVGGQLQLFYQTTSNRLAYVTSPPFSISRLNADPGMYYVYINTPNGQNTTTKYQLIVEYP